MPGPDLLVVCSIALLAVFVVLGALAAIMRLLILLSPPPGPDGAIDPAIVTAVTEAVQAACPGMRVTGIEETR